MAKAQGVSLNPSEITGMCGRLRCCLIYEYEQYVEARQHLPKQGRRVGTTLGEGKVVSLFPLKDTALIDLGDRRIEVHREDIVPLEEWRALQEKAAQECDHGENCTCGAKAAAAPAKGISRPTSSTEAPKPEVKAKRQPKSQTPQGERKGKSKSSRRRRRRRRR
jgi:hypothetical protein